MLLLVTVDRETFFSWTNFADPRSRLDKVEGPKWGTNLDENSELLVEARRERDLRLPIGENKIVYVFGRKEYDDMLSRQDLEDSRARIRASGIDVPATNEFSSALKITPFITRAIPGEVAPIEPGLTKESWRDFWTVSPQPILKGQKKQP